jgi:phenylalanyl-tRNA synthetase alpha chain
MSTTPVSTDVLVAALSTRDLTDPAQGPHALQILVEEAVRALTLDGMQVRLDRSRPVVPVQDNYDLLGYAKDAVARDARYTLYVSDTCVLRSHTSAGIPSALRRLAADADAPATVLLVLPGICHRRDAIDRLHTGTPHQLDLWLLRRGGRRVDRTDLADMVSRLLAEVLPGRHWTWTAVEHPYTVGGRQIDVVDEGRPVEIAECGLAAPHVLSDAGVDAERWSGLALGMGLDRVLMLRTGVPDIRLLRSTDPRVSTQMLDLAPYRPVSDLPPVRRDLSLAVAAGDDAETLGNRVRETLGPDADLVEEVTVLSTTPYAGLPGPARDRLGIRPGQDNVLLRVVLRPTDRTLTAGEANALRDRIYSALHEGSTVGSGSRVTSTASPGESPSSAAAAPPLTAIAMWPAESTNTMRSPAATSPNVEASTTA